MLKISSTNKNYPQKLLRLHNPPKKLFIESNNWQELTNLPHLAVIGSRRPSAYGQAATKQISCEAASRGVVIISGLALGIDSYAHKAALEAKGKTIAVLPSGLNNIYPASHKNLAKQIIDSGGAIVSEYEPDDKIAFKSNFIARNRIIAGLSDAILIPEAAENSGSLHTAQFAIEAGIEVLALPGQINNPMAAGSNNLIKSGAQIVTRISDVLGYLKLPKTPNKHKIDASTPEEYVILNTILGGVTDGDELFDIANLTIEQFNQTLTMLEITGKIKALGNNNWHLT